MPCPLNLVSECLVFLRESVDQKNGLFKMFYLKKSVIFSSLFTSFMFFCVFVLFFSCTHKKPYQFSKSLTEGQRTDKSQIGRKSSDFLLIGWNLFKRGKFNEARNWFEKLNYKDEGFISAILEIQKINYIQKDWNRFFGLAVYYRKKLLSSHEMSMKNFHQKMLALEILALLRHCHFNEALEIIEWSLELAERLKKDSSKIQKTIYFFKLKKRIGEVKTQKTDWKKQIRLWPLDSGHIKWLSNPKHLRVKVKSRC